MGGRVRGSLGLAQLVALNDEIEALVRAGIPLERGLRATGSGVRGRLGGAMRDLAGRLEAGEPLADALERSGHGLPPLYRAVVEAGLRSGSLAEALQGLARIGRATLEARRTLALACVYPLLVLSVAYALLVLFLVALVPRLIEAREAFRIGRSPVLEGFAALGSAAWVWAPVGPILLVGGLIAWGLLGKARALDGSGRLGRVAQRLPGLRRVVAEQRAAQFVDLLAHLIAHEVPLDRSVALAGEATGAGAIGRDAKRLAASLAAGRPGLAAEFPALPGLAVWMLGSGVRSGDLAAGLSEVAQAARRRAERRAEFLRVALPGTLIVALGGLTVLIYGVALLVPLREIWESLALPA